MIMNENYIKKIMDRIGKDLFPPFGKIMGYEVHSQEKLIFSQIWKIKLYYNESTKNVVFKKYLKEKRTNSDQKLSIEREYSILKYLYHQFSLLKGINVIKPITFLADEDILITEEFVGDKLNVLVVNQVRWIPRNREKRQIQGHFFQCGRWLRYFQKFTKKDEVIPFRKNHYVENVRKKLDSSAKYGLKDTLNKKIYRFIDSKFKRIGNQQLDLVGYHSDFASWNVLAGNNEIRILDFDRFSYRNRYDDLTLFLCCLEGEKSILGMMNKNIDALKDAFLQGHDIEKINHDIFDLYILKNTLKALTMIDIYENANTRFLDVLYERYRKKRRIELYLNNIEELVNKEGKLN